jgi:GDP-D-mannose 3',5'-epimerase
MKTALVLGGGGFIGSHLVKRLKLEGLWVRSVDLHHPAYSISPADEFIIGDLTDEDTVSAVLLDSNNKPFDEIYQLAADMGGAGYIFTGENDANVMTNSASINLLVAKYAHKYGVGSLFYSSSACAYPAYNQTDPDNPKCNEASAYPAEPDSEYGWEKLFSERLYLAYQRNFGLNIHVARFHNIFGIECTYKGGREKSPAALCRKVLEAPNNSTIEIWGSGNQTRSFLYVDECVEGIIRLNRSNFSGPVNIGSDEMISINNFTQMIIDISGKNLTIKNIPGPEGVKGRNSDNTLIKQKLGWQPNYPLKDGTIKLYKWLESVYQK